MADGDLMDLQEVIDTLGISEQDLQNMVAQGKVKAVRAGRTIKFRRDEVMGMKGGRSTEPTIIIPAQEAQEQPAPAPEPTVDESAATVVPEAPAGGVVPVDTQEISLEDEELEIVPLEDEAAATVAESSPVPGGEDSGIEELTVVEEVEEEPAGAGSSRRPSSRSSRGRMSRRISQAAYAEPQASPLWAGTLILTAIILLFVGSVFGVILIKGIYDEEKQQAYVPAYLEWVVDKFKGQ